MEDFLMDLSRILEVDRFYNECMDQDNGYIVNDETEVLFINGGFYIVDIYGNNRVDIVSYVDLMKIIEKRLKMKNIFLFLKLVKEDKNIKWFYMNESSRLCRIAGRVFVHIDGDLMYEYGDTDEFIDELKLYW